MDSIIYFYLKTKPFKEEEGLVYINGFLLHYDEYLTEYEAEAIVTMDTDLYLDLLLLKAKHKKYSFLNMSNAISINSNPVNITEGKLSGQDRNGDYKILEEI
jgi:hypothetical protein